MAVNPENYVDMQNKRGDCPPANWGGLDDGPSQKMPENCREGAGKSSLISPLHVFLAVFLAWAVVATYVDQENGKGHLIFVLVIIAALAVPAIASKCGTDVSTLCSNFSSFVSRYPRTLRTVQVSVLIAISVSWLATSAWHEPSRLRPVGGQFILLFITWATSYHRDKIQWYPVISGVVGQLLLGAFVLRTKPGFALFHAMSEKTESFFAHVVHGVAFVFGEAYHDHIFAFLVMGTIVYFSAVASVLLYLGWFQIIFTSMSKVVSSVMHTSPTESFSSAANVFLSQIEIPLLVRPFLTRLTTSEVHTLMACGFATVSGSVLAAFVNMNISTQHMIAASVMSCPAALAISKLSFPETEEVDITMEEVAEVLRDKNAFPDKSIIEAAVTGATGAIAICAGVCANIIAFQSLWHFLDNLSGFFLQMIGFSEGYTMSSVFSYIAWPLAYMIGVPAEDCFQVADLIVKKTCLNEFVAYERLGKIKLNQEMSERAIVIATYALNGFANVGSMGMQVATLSMLAPSRKGVFAKVVVRALYVGSTTCFMTACVAAMLL